VNIKQPTENIVFKEMILVTSDKENPKKQHVPIKEK